MDARISALKAAAITVFGVLCFSVGAFVTLWCFGIHPSHRLVGASLILGNIIFCARVVYVKWYEKL